MADAAEIHDLIARLAARDAVHGSGTVADEALRAFRGTRCADREAVAELGELTGWLLFDAERHREARQINKTALALTKDPDLRWFILSNQALASVHTGQFGEALRIAENPGGRPPRRVKALFDVRAARALAELGARHDALRRFDRARNAFLDDPAPRDPTWTWWFDERELTGHHGLLHASLGNHDEAIPLLHKAADESTEPWARYIYRTHLLRTLLAAGADHDAVATDVIPMIGTIASARTEKLLCTLDPVSDAVHEIRIRLSDPPRS